MTLHHDISDAAPELAPRISATAAVLDGLSLYGHQRQSGDPDPRPLPDEHTLDGAISDIFDVLTGAFSDTRLEPDVDDLLWNFAGLFHNKAARMQRLLEDNEDKQKRSQEEQDGSEVKSVELERLIDQGLDLIERRDAFERIRDLAAERYEAATGSAWRPRAGSYVNRKRMTAAVIDSRDFIAARRAADVELMLPKGPKIAFSGGTEYADHKRIWAVLDQVFAKHPGMVLVHGGTATGAEKIASCWASARAVTQIAFKPDFKRYGNAAPFKRNDVMLALMPKGAIVFPGKGVTNNFADKAKALGIPVLDHRKEAGA
jgi:YspA, cpYpsA-related SLOG family